MLRYFLTEVSYLYFFIQFQVNKIKKFLEAYIRVEEKDRMHTLNHFTHVRRNDPAEAKHMQKDTSEHLTVIDERIKQSLDMLHHYKKIEKELLSDISMYISLNVLTSLLLADLTKGQVGFLYHLESICCC